MKYSENIRNGFRGQVNVWLKEYLFLVISISTGKVRVNEALAIFWDVDLAVPSIGILFRTAEADFQSQILPAGMKK